jgi:CBS domain containing-hemolysin-like protein
MSDKKELKNEKVNVKIILSALWIAVMFIYVYADIKTLFQPEIPEQIMAGVVAGMTINQCFLFYAALLMSIPASMIFLSLVLNPGINRWLNIVLSFLHILLIIVTRFVHGKVWYYYIYYQSLEAIIHFLIIWYAWRWPMVQKTAE